MSPLSVEVVGLPKFEQALEYHQREVLPKATARALNRVAATMRTRTTRTVAKTMGVKQNVVRWRMKINNARVGQSEMAATIDVRGRALNLVHFNASQSERGVSARPWGENRFFRSAFIATMRGQRVVMIRHKRSSGGGRRLVARLPIRGLLGPGIAKTALDPELVKERAETMRERFPIELRSGLAFYTKSITGGKL